MKGMEERESRGRKGGRVRGRGREEKRMDGHDGRE